MLVVMFAVALALLCFALVCLALAERNLRKAHENLRMFRGDGTRPEGFSQGPCVSTTSKVLGTRTRVMGITAAYSSIYGRGTARAERSAPTWLSLANSYTALGSTGASKDGADGGRTPRERAV